MKKMTSTDTYQLKWHSHSSHLNGSVAALLRSERFTDVVLCTTDGSQIPAHKFILSSCSVYLASLFDGQRSVTRMGGMIYVVLPSDITTKALKIIVEYMYKGETTVSNEVLDTVLKAGEILKIRGLWRQPDEAGGESTAAEKTANTTVVATSANKQPIPALPKKQDTAQQKMTVKKDDKLLKTFSPVQQQGVTRPMFIGPPKLVFIKTSEGGTQAALRPGAPKGQTILVASAPSGEGSAVASIMATSSTSTSTVSVSKTTVEDSVAESPPPRILRRHAVERKYGKRQKNDPTIEVEESKEVEENQDIVPQTLKKSAQTSTEMTEIQVKDEPDWDASSIEEEERSIAEMFHAEMNVKSEPTDDVDIEEDSLIYSPLACELCAEVFTLPAAWVRHVEGHARGDHQHARKRKHRSASDDTEETMALLRCDLCQKHFPNPAEWVRHIQSAHTERGRAKQDLLAMQENFPVARVDAHPYAHAHRRASVRVRSVQQGFQREIELAAASAHAARPDHQLDGGGRRRRHRGGRARGREPRARPQPSKARVLRTRREGRKRARRARPAPAARAGVAGRGERRAGLVRRAAQAELLAVPEAASRALLRQEVEAINRDSPTRYRAFSIFNLACMSNWTN